MGERTRGIYRIVTVPALYTAIQNFLGGRNAQQAIRDQVFQNISGKNVLEIGCGPGKWVPMLTDAASYTGIDWNQSHIETARAAHGSSKVRFLCGDLSDTRVLPSEQPFDVVLAIGILHHLDDATARKVVQRSAELLVPGGRFLAIEPVYHPGQNPIARLLKALDSGKNIRSEDGYRSLFTSEFERLDSKIKTNLMRVPYSHCLLSGVRS